MKKRFGTLLGTLLGTVCGETQPVETQGTRARRGVLVRIAQWAMLPAALTLLGTAHGLAAQGSEAMSPSGAAFLVSESRRVEDQFVGQVAEIVSIPAATVREALPDERRITSTLARLEEALALRLGRNLSDAERAAIHAADQRRRATLAEIRRLALER